MLQPPLNQLTSDEKPESALLTKYISEKPVGKALEEIADGEVFPDELFLKTY